MNKINIKGVGKLVVLALTLTASQNIWAEPLAQTLSSSEQSNQQSGNVISNLWDGKPSYYAFAPIDNNFDEVIKICLNGNYASCDYTGTAGNSSQVNIAFQGQIIIEHEITEIYPSDLPLEQRPNGIDEITNIYLQEGVYGGATKQSYKTLNNGFKNFSDYLELEIDSVNKRTIIRWNIPREEGFFGDIGSFSNLGQANWYITFAVKGYPYFQHGRGGQARSFQISVTSEESPRFGNYYSPVLPKITLSDN